jgi:hypothetical protein
MLGWRGVDLEDENGAIINNTQQVRALDVDWLSIPNPTLLQQCSYRCVNAILIIWIGLHPLLCQFQLIAKRHNT